MIRQITIILILFVLFAFPRSGVSQWIHDTSPNDPNSVYCFAESGSNLFAGGFSPGCWLSTDNGVSWAVRGGPHRNYNLGIYSLAFMGTNLIAGTDSGIWRSTDDGRSWFSAYDKLTANLPFYSVAVKGANIFAIGYGLFVSNDTGKNWRKASNEIQYMFSGTPFAIKGQDMYAATQGGILRSTDDGIDWITLRPERAWAIAADSLNIFAATDSGVLRSTDNGTNWVVTSITRGTGIGVLYLFGTYLFLGPSRSVDASCLVSTDFGASWINLNEGHRSTSLIVSGPNIVKGSNNTGIWYRPLSGVFDQVKNTTSSDLNLSLSPNPTTGIITVHNTSANILHVTFSNILGESVLELEHPNAPEFTIDLSKLPPGIYFARFSLANGVITRKIVKE